MPEPLRMNAYYYGFDETGIREIDLILSAVARAGKAYHHTESWTEPGWDGGPSCVDEIQGAARAAATEVKRLRREHDPRCLSLTESENNIYCDCRTIAGLDFAARVTGELTADRDRLRTVIDEELARHTPIPGDQYAEQRCQGCIAGYDPHTGRLIHAAYPCQTRLTLTPAATTDEETN